MRVCVAFGLKFPFHFIPSCAMCKNILSPFFILSGYPFYKISLSFFNKRNLKVYPFYVYSFQNFYSSSCKCSSVYMHVVFQAFISKTHVWVRTSSTPLSIKSHKRMHVLTRAEMHPLYFDRRNERTIVYETGILLL